MKKVLRVNATLQEVMDAVNYTDRKRHIRENGCFYFVSGIRVSISDYKVEGQTRIYLSHRKDREDYGMIENVLYDVLLKLKESKITYSIKN